MSDLVTIIPEIFILIMACVLLVADLFLKQEQRDLTYWLTQATLLGALLLSLTGQQAESVLAFGGSFIRDPMSDVLKIFVYIVTAAVFVYSRSYLKNHNLFKGEFYVLGLFAVLGMMIMISAGSFLSLYLGLELLALSLYAMVAFDYRSGRASEAAMKYFVLGAVASGIMLYGMSIMYGLTGSLDHHVIADRLLNVSEESNVGVAFAMVFIIVGIAFKLGAVPFHMWVPDVYDGAPTPVTTFLSSAPKLAAFAIVIRLMVEGMGGLYDQWQQVFFLLAVLSLFIGNLVAIAQTNIKRMFAYSTISHVGFIALGVATGSADGYSAAMFYTIAYALMSIGGFGVILILSRKDHDVSLISDLAGLNDRHAWTAFMMLLLLISMIGIPGTVGFIAKLWVLEALINGGFIWLAGFAVVMAVIGAFYYLRVIKTMYFDKPEGELAVQSGRDMNLVLSANGLLMVVLGLFPGLLVPICVAVFSS